VALAAFNVNMLSIKLVSRVVMVEIADFPVVKGMAPGTIRGIRLGELPLMFILVAEHTILFHPGKPLFGGFAWCLGKMAIPAGEGGMFSFEFKGGCLVIKLNF
jgi:hypothetical protein